MKKMPTILAMVGIFGYLVREDLLDVVARDLYLRCVTSGIDILPVDFYLFLLARHQREIVVRVEVRQELLAIQVAYNVDADHQGRRLAWILDSDGRVPGAILALSAVDIRLQGNLRQLLQVLIVVLLQAAVVEVLGDDLAILEKAQLDEVYLRDVRRVFQLEALVGRVFLAVYFCLFLPSDRSVHLQDLRLRGQSGVGAGAVVHDLDFFGGRVPLDMERLGSFLDGEVSGGRLEVIVIRLPNHRGPARVTHPHQEAHAFLAARLEEAAMAVVVDPLRQVGEFLHVLWLPVA